MSRSSRVANTSSATITLPMHPPLDRDVVMGPPPLPPQIAPSSSAGARSKDGENQDVAEKYRRLKRKYFELEEKHKDAVIELRSSGERAVQWRSERSALLDRIGELEAMTTPGQHPPPHPLLPYPASTAYPRSLNNPHAQKRFHMNLERALAEAEVEDPSMDPILTSRHVGPNARKRIEAEMKERMEEEAREARRIARRPRARGKDKDKDKAPEPPREFVREPGRPERQAGSSGRERERVDRDRDGAGPPLTLAPPPGSHFQAPSPPHQQVVVSSSGTRLRIKPPAPPSQQHYMDVDSPPRHDSLPLPQEDVVSSRREPTRRETLPSSHELMQAQPPIQEQVPLRQDPPSRQNPMSPSLQETSRLRQDHMHLPPPPVDPPGPSRGHARSHSRRSVSPARSSPPHAMDEDGVAFSQPPPQSQMVQSPTQQRADVPQTQAQTPPGSSGPKSPLQSTRSPITKFRQVAAAPQTSMPPPLRPVQPAPTLPLQASTATPHPVAPHMQVYAMTTLNSNANNNGNNISSSSTRQVKSEDPMGPNGAAQAMMQTFTPIMHPIPHGQAPGSGVAQIARNKPKRLKAHTVTSKSFSIPVVPRDKRGVPMLPLNVGIMTVVNLGQICMREHFHTERYIFPVGYEVTRRYLSTIDPNSDCVYHCTILDGGDGPKFQIIAADQPDKPIIAGTATGAWSVIVRAANHIRNRQHSNSVSGPDFFGLGQNSIKHLIQELPNADRLKDYVWQNFVEGGHLFVHENRQLGSGRHQALPAPGDDQDDVDVGDSVVTPTQSYYNEEPRELQIIQVPPPEQGNPPMALKPLQFHQEFPDRESPREPSRGRRASVHDTYEFAQDERMRQQQQPPSHRSSSHSHSHAHSHSHSHSHSPALSPRASHSPVMQREREPYSPQAHRSPYHSPPVPQQVPVVPATFANIMNAYPAPPMPSNGSEPASPYDTPPINGSGRSRRAAAANGMDR